MHRHGRVRRLVGRIAVLRDQAGGEAARLAEAGSLGPEQRDVGQAARRLRHPHLGLPVDQVALRVDHARDVDELRRTLGIERVLVLARPLHAHRTAELL
jgi:hypothetical protein